MVDGKITLNRFKQVLSGIRGVEIPIVKETSKTMREIALKVIDNPSKPGKPLSKKWRQRKEKLIRDGIVPAAGNLQGGNHKFLFSGELRKNIVETPLELIPGGVAGGILVKSYKTYHQYLKTGPWNKPRDVIGDLQQNSGAIFSSKAFWQWRKLHGNLRRIFKNALHGI